MRKGIQYIAATTFLLASFSAYGGEAADPVRMGSGMMTFDTVPGWGLGPERESLLGPTHGSVVVDAKGRIYASARKGIFVFSPEGRLLHRFVGEQYSNIHDLEIRTEQDREFLYGARNEDREGVKIEAETGSIVMKLEYPDESGLGLVEFKPTAITVGPDDVIYLADGYASNYIFMYDGSGKYLKHFGSKGNGLRDFNVAHGMTLDTRYDPPRLLICDRNHEPKGRLLHYDLDGNFIDVVISGLGLPTSVAVQGDFVSVTDLYGRLVILDKNNTIISVLGNNPDPAKGINFNVPQDEWEEGFFSGTHGSYWDADGNLYVQDWNVAGRLMKLVRVNWRN